MGNNCNSKPFIVTKVWRNFHGYEQTKKCFNESLNRLGLDQVDLVLIHWPGPAYNRRSRDSSNQSKKEQENNNNNKIIPPVQEGQEDIKSLRLETWRALEDLYMKEKKCRAIGVSNYTIKHLKQLLSWEKLRIKPMINQVKCIHIIIKKSYVNIVN